MISTTIQTSLSPKAGSSPKHTPVPPVELSVGHSTTQKLTVPPYPMSGATTTAHYTRLQLASTAGSQTHIHSMGSGFIEFDRTILSELSQTSFSILARVYRTGPGTIIGFISDNYDDYVLLRQTSDYPNFRLSNELQLDTPWTAYTDRWIDVILVFSIESNSLTLYIENQHIDETSVTNAHSLDLTNETANIGRDPRSRDQGFRGRISDLRFYNKAITPDEVDRVYHTGSIIP